MNFELFKIKKVFMSKTCSRMSTILTGFNNDKIIFELRFRKLPRKSKKESNKTPTGTKIHNRKKTHVKNFSCTSIIPKSVYRQKKNYIYIYI